MAGEISVEVGSDNVFADLGLPDPDELLRKSALVQRIDAAIRELEVTSHEAAARLGIEASELGDLLRGRVDLFSTDRLFDFLNALGRDVEIVIRPKPASQLRGSTRVLLATEA